MIAVPKNKDYYYKIVFNLFFHFPATKSIKPFTPKTLAKDTIDIYPNKCEIITIPERTFAFRNYFKIYDSEFNGSIISYIENNIEKFTAPVIWQPIKDEAIEMYLSFVKTEYGIVLDKKQVKCTEKFAWDIDFDEKEFEEQCRINDEIDRDIESMKRCHENRNPYFW